MRLHFTHDVGPHLYVVRLDLPCIAVGWFISYLPVRRYYHVLRLLLRVVTHIYLGLTTIPLRTLTGHFMRYLTRIYRLIVRLLHCHHTDATPPLHCLRIPTLHDVTHRSTRLFPVVTLRFVERVCRLRGSLRPLLFFGLCRVVGCYG